MAKTTPPPSYAVRLTEPDEDDVYTVYREEDALLIHSYNDKDFPLVSLSRDNAFELAAYIQQIFTEK